MTDLELIFSMLGEAATTEITRTQDAQGFDENRTGNLCRGCFSSMEKISSRGLSLDSAVRSIFFLAPDPLFGQFGPARQSTHSLLDSSGVALQHGPPTFTNWVFDLLHPLIATFTTSLGMQLDMRRMLVICAQLTFGHFALNSANA